MKKYFLLCVVVFLSACHDGPGSSTAIEGTYLSSFDKSTFTFKKDGTIYETTVTGTRRGHPFTYKVEGNQIKVFNSVLQMKLMQDGSIDAGVPFGILKRIDK